MAEEEKEEEAVLVGFERLNHPRIWTTTETTTITTEEEKAVEE